MAVVINGSTGIDKVQDDIITSAKIVDGTIASGDIASGVTGKVLQVVQQTFSGTASTTVSDNTFADTGINVSITPSSASSKVLITVSVGKSGCVTSYRCTNFRLVRGSTDIALGDSANNRVRASFYTYSAGTDQASQTASFSFLDTPSTTSTINYKLMFSGSNGESTRVNYGADVDNVDGVYSRTTSTILVTEIGA